MNRVEDVFDCIEDEAYAHIIWGDSPAEVSRWLVVEKGLTEAQAKVLVGRFLSERRAEVRRSGVRLIGTSIGIIALCGVLFAINSSSSVHFYKVLAFLVAGLLYGIYRLLVGIGRVVSGRAQGAVSDLE